MKTKIFILIFSIFALSVKAQEQKYYEFGWNGKYGIVNSDGQEIVEPTYDWKSYTLGYKSPYIALNSKNDGAFIINTSTGTQERFHLLADNYQIKLEGKEYLYAYNDKEAFLINNFDLEQRKVLPKRYEEVRQRGDYLIGYLQLSKDEQTVDILSKKDLEIKLKDQKIIQINDYKKATDGKLIYAFTKVKSTVFYDENLKQIATVPKQLTEFKDIQDYLLSARKIAIVEEPYPITSAMTGSAPNYPHINTNNETQEEGYVWFNIYKSKNNFTPFFKFKWDMDINNRISNDRYNNKIEAWKKKEKSLSKELQFLFYTDVKREKILFPQKYWNEIGLEQMYDSRKMDFDPNEIAVSKSNKAPYKFEPFSIEREDGFYEVIKTEGEFYKNVVLAKKAVVSKSEIEEAKADVDEYLHRPIVIVTFNETGTLKFAQATEKNIGKPIAIVVNKKVISMPVVHSKIAGGKLHIAGDFTKEEVKEMAERLKSK